MKILTKNKITVALLAIILIVASALTVALFDRQPSVAHALKIGADAKIYSCATIEENFADDTVLVVLNGQTTRSFKQYTANDFAETRVDGHESVEKKVVSKATVDDDFADDTVLVALSVAASRDFCEYTTEGFPEADFCEITDLTGDTVGGK